MRAPPGDFPALIQRCATLLDLKTIHAAILRRSLHHHNHLLAADLITHYSHLGSTSLAHSTFTSASPSHPSAFHALVRVYVDSPPPGPRLALELYRRLRLHGLPRHQHDTFPLLIKACSSLRDLHVGSSIHCDAFHLGIASDPYVVNALIAFYGKCARVDIARKLFDTMPQRTPVSWSALLSAYTHNGLRNDALQTFSLMLSEGLTPNRGAFMNLMIGGCVSDVKSADELYLLLEKNGLHKDALVSNSVVRMYVNCGAIDRARKLFDEMPDRTNPVAWNSMIEGYTKAGSPLEALHLFKEMEIPPNRETVRLVVIACCKLASRSTARSIHSYVLKNFSDLESVFIDLYARCGILGASRKLFDRISEKNVASWNAMIYGYGMNGRGKDALILFEEMKDASSSSSSVQPDDETFLSVLYSCCFSGLVDEWRKVFDSMKDFDIEPNLKHYACVVELLGRAGKLDDAQEFIRSMPIEPDSSVWDSLLSASIEHKNMEFVESSARSILELDPLNARCCVLLSKICRSSGGEKEAGEIEALMKEKGKKRAIGFSFVEANHVVYKFATGDRSNPKWDEIYKEVERLLESIEEHGYEPDRNLMLDDVEDEIDEESPHGQSEKLAIAFGLLNSTPDEEILVCKNGSISANCLNFAKLVSKVEGRVIVLRDARRFYRFIDGSCS